MAQGKGTPLARIRVFSESVCTKEILDACYKRRFGGSAGDFLVLSNGGGGSVLVNATSVNNTVVFIDPLSLSIYNTLYFSPSDYKMSSNLSKLIQIMAPKLQKLQQ